MLDGQFSTQAREHLLQAKENTLGSIQNDRVDELPEAEYLAIEIKETREKRRTHSMPLFAIGAMTLFFSFAANTTLTLIAGILIGICSLAAAVWIVTKHSQALRELQSKLEAVEAVQ